MIKETRLFYTPVWQADLQNDPGWSDARTAMLTRIAALQKNRSGVARTNFGGWQSEDDLYRHTEFSWLIGQIMSLSNQFAPAFSPKKRFDDGILWANVNRRGDFNSIHTHPDAVLSGVIYLKFEQIEQGVIEFFDAREGTPTAQWRCYMRLEDRTELTDAVHTVEPAEGTILFFPGWLKHWVTPNMTDSERISVSFNIRMG